MANLKKFDAAYFLAQEEYIWAMRMKAADMRNQDTFDGKKNIGQSPWSALASRKSKVIMPLDISKRNRMMASLVPDEIIFNVDDYSQRSCVCCLLFGDVSGFTELCEKYNQTGRGGPSRLTNVLNKYMGNMVQEVISHGGDVLKFSGDAFLAIWKCNRSLTLRDLVHQAIDCALIIQKNYSTYETDVGIYLRVKLAIAAGNAIFSLIGDEKHSHYILVGPPINDVKVAEAKSSPGEIIVAQSAWYYVNANEYLTEDLDNGHHVKIFGVGPSWRGVLKSNERYSREGKDSSSSEISSEGSLDINHSLHQGLRNQDEEFALRPAVNYAANLGLREPLKKFIIAPIMRGIEMDEPIEYLTEMRQVSLVFINVVDNKISLPNYVNFVNECYQIICAYASKYLGCVDKVSLFDKDIMFVVIFGLRGFKHSLECQHALKCSASCFKQISKISKVISVSIAVTTGKTYCGVVGHTLRREYTVISLTVNKAARLMVAYPNRVTCDHQTFLHSKMEAIHFILQEYRPLKGITDPGPVYEFKEIFATSSEVPTYLSHYPILGREEEIELYRKLLDTFVKHVQQRNSVYQKNVCSMLVISGDAKLGKTRLLDECVYRTNSNIPVNRFNLLQPDKKKNFRAIRLMFAAPLGINDYTSMEEKTRKISRRMAATDFEEYLCGLNDILNVKFSVTNKYKSLDEEERALVQYKLVKRLCYGCFTVPWVIAMDNGEYIDDDSWILISSIVNLDAIFMVTTVNKCREVSDYFYELVKHPKINFLELQTINKLYHAGLACQMLNVQAIPPDLENVIQSKSNGCPGWIENFLTNLIQSNGLVIKQISHKDAHKHGLVTPPVYILQRLTKKEIDAWKKVMEETNIVRQNSNVDDDPWCKYVDICRDSYTNVIVREAIDLVIFNETYLMACFVTPKFDITSVDSETSLDVHILKTFDSLTYYEQLVLKCSSVLGETFPRDMLAYIIDSEEPKLTAIAVKVLFEIRVFCCAKGDFSHGGNYCLNREKGDNPTKIDAIKCDCKGLVVDDGYMDLPKYASCGFLRFVSSEFRNITYNLLTDNQKKEFHSRAARYVEKETQKCRACGNVLFAFQTKGQLDDNIVAKKFHKRKPRLSIVYDHDTYNSQISSIHSGALKADKVSTTTDTTAGGDFSYYSTSMGLVGPQKIHQLTRSMSLTRTFSTYDFTNCECVLILNTTYVRLIDHYRGAGNWPEMLEAMVNSAKVCISLKNYTESINILNSALKFLQEHKIFPDEPAWKQPILEANVLSLKGCTLLSLQQDDEAAKNLHLAVKKFGVHFPTSLTSLMLKNLSMRLKQRLRLYMLPDSFFKKMGKYEENYCCNLAACLGYLCKYYIRRGKWEKAEFAATMALNKVLQSHGNFALIMVSFENMLRVALFKKQQFFSLALEVHSLRYCHKKRNEPDAGELQAVANLYYVIFKARLFRSELEKALHIGYIIVRISINVNDLHLVLVILPLLANVLYAKQYVREAIAILHEMEYYTTYEESIDDRARFIAACIHFQLTTGFTFMLYADCEKFYNNESKNIKDREPLVILMAHMWVWCLRNELWEAAAKYQSVLYERLPIRDNTRLMSNMLLICEGALLLLVHKMNQRNLNEQSKLEIQVEECLKKLYQATGWSMFITARYLHLGAYYEYIKNNEARAFMILKKALQSATAAENLLEVGFIHHSEAAWSRSLAPALKTAWKEKCDPYNRIDYHDIESNEMRPIYYTFPTPLYLF